MASTEFTTDQYDSVYPDGIERHYWNRARNHIIIDQLRDAGLANKRILEIGCGRGVVLRGLRTAGIHCYGVELAEVSVPGDLEEFLHTGKSFEDLDQSLVTSVEVVLLFDVIEHIEDEKDFLKKILAFFPNLTHLVVTVPARKELWSNYDTHYGHFRRYGLDSLKKVVEEGGLRSISSSYFFHALYLPARLIALLDFSRSIVIVPPKGISEFFHMIIAKYLIVEHLVVPSWVPGTSIINVMECYQKQES